MKPCHSSSHACDGREVNSFGYIVHVHLTTALLILILNKGTAQRTKSINSLCSLCVRAGSVTQHFQLVLISCYILKIMWSLGLLIGCEFSFSLFHPGLLCYLLCISCHRVSCCQACVVTSTSLRVSCFILKVLCFFV